MFHRVFYTNLLVKRGFDATTYGPFIFMRPAQRENRAMLEHEKVHVAQFWSNPLTFGLRYLFSKKARWRYEAEAYRAQLVLQPERLVQFSHALASKYGEGLSFTDARAMILGDK